MPKWVDKFVEWQGYREGYDAFTAKLPITANPFTWGSQQQAKWAEGWRKANEESRPKRPEPQPGDGYDNEIPF